jgi:hypothetical protein
MIRKDLFAVKVFQDDGGFGAFITEAMFRSHQSAKQYKRDVESNKSRHFPLVEPKIVHPSDLLVDAFVCLGNEVRD